jgi:prepilin-type N-terminal cleavage/methylation domain-containing protein
MKSYSFLKMPARPVRGFTLIEILLVMGIIAILAAVVIVAINPARQFAQARNSQRTSNVFAILNAVGQNISDNSGVFTCSGGSIPNAATVISSTGYNIASCVVPTYLPSLPFDPGADGAHFTSMSDYNTGYTIVQDSTTGRITVSAPEALETSELGKTISATR